MQNIAENDFHDRGFSVSLIQKFKENTITILSFNITHLK